MSYWQLYDSKHDLVKEDLVITEYYMETNANLFAKLGIKIFFEDLASQYVIRLWLSDYF